MEPPEDQPAGRPQTPTLVWLGLGILVVAIFAAVVVLLGKPSGGLPKIEPAPNQADQAVIAAPEPKAAKLD